MKYHMIVSLSLLAITQVLIAAKDDQKKNKPEPVFEHKIEAFELSLNGEPMAALDKAGNLVINGEKIGLIDANGVFSGADGKKIAQLKTDGTFVGPDGVIFGTMLKNGDFKGPQNMTFSWKDNQLKENNKTISLDKKTDAARRLASCVLVMLFTIEQVEVGTIEQVEVGPPIE